VHSTNVSVLTIFQGETLGIKDQLLHDIGLAALLHDVGKMFISKEILEKDGPLDEREFAEMKLHPVYGANYLAKIEHISRIAPIVAFEHHRKYNGTGYPSLNLNGKEQHLCSQLIAISDFFDALRSWRPYRESWDIKEILELMKEEAGKSFNPLLVDNFLKFFLTALSEK
jgi:HD-GYP domain-containing protein (c-di-GMP phosphodiesterase class II)